MKDWTKVSRELLEQVKKMDEEEAYQYIWELYQQGKITKKVHDWVAMWI